VPFLILLKFFSFVLFFAAKCADLFRQVSSGLPRMFISDQPQRNKKTISLPLVWRLSRLQSEKRMWAKEKIPIQKSNKSLWKEANPKAKHGRLLLKK
jgi:hypothetical protein